MKKLPIKNLLKIILCVAVLGFCTFAISGADFVSEKNKIEDFKTVESFLKFNLLTHENMNLGDVVPSFNGDDKEWSILVNTQMQKYFSGNPFVTKIPGDPFVFSYRLNYADGSVVYVLWFDHGGNKVVGDDVTIDIDVSDMDIKEDVVMSERFLQPGETEPLVRGYLLEENMHAKVLVTETPIFLFKR